MNISSAKRKDMIDTLHHEHTPERVQDRINSKTPLARLHLRDAVLGGMDGCITTFAIVAGSAGAQLDSIVVIILGLSNLIADGLSMAIGNYMGVKSEYEQLMKARETEHKHIELVPEGEKEEVRQIFRSKGFEGDKLEDIVETVASNKKWWVDVMIHEEWGLSPVTPQPVTAAIATFMAFVAVGLLPILPFLIFPYENSAAGFPTSCAATVLAFLLIGVGRSRMTSRPLIKAVTETFAAGIVAAGAAYAIGYYLKAIVG